MSGKALNVQVGWYGKLPGVGDFASRGLSRDVVGRLDDWLQDGLAALQQQNRQWQQTFALSPVWNAILPAGLISPYPCLACIGPSLDRVGRDFPLTVLLHTPDIGYFPSLIQGGDWFSRTREALRRAVDGRQLPDQLDQGLRSIASGAWDEQNLPQHAMDQSGQDILDVIGLPAEADAITVPLSSGSLPWPNLPWTFSPYTDLSYWWSIPTPQFPGAIPTIHRGPLNTSLFLHLFDANIS